MSGFIFKAADFEGPLDLLLHLIRSNEYEIESLLLLDIIDQFVAVVSSCTLQEKADFALMSAHLIALKARYINKGRLDEYEELQNDPLEILVEKLRTYRKIKEVGEYLKEKEITDCHFFKEPETAEIAEECDFLSVNLLAQALQRVIDNLSRFDDGGREFFRRKRRTFVPVREKKKYILDLLSAAGTVRFSELCGDRDEIIASFLALLELLKASLITVRQEDVFSEIFISAARSAS